MVANLTLFNAPVSPAEVQSDLNVLVNAFNAGGITTAQTNQSLGIYAVGNTTGQTSSLTFDARSISIQGSGNISVGESNGSFIISGQNPTVFQAGTNATALVNGQVIFQAGNNISLSQSISSNSATITINASAPTQSIQSYNIISASGNTSGTINTFSSGNIIFAGGNNITLSQNSNTINISAAAIGAGSFTAGMSNLGNTSGTTGIVANQLIFAGGNNITLSQSINGQSGTITILGNSAGGNFSAGVNTDGNTSGTTGFAGSQIEFVGGNNITLSQSINGQSATITMSAFNQSVQTQNNIAGMSAGTQSVTSGTIVFSNSNGVSFGMSGSSIITASIAAQSAQTQSLIQAIYDGANSISTGTIRFSNANNVSFGINGQTITASVNPSAAFSAGVSNIGNTLGSTGTVSNRIVFAGGNNITLSQSTAAGGATITISAGGGGPATISNFIYPESQINLLANQMSNGSISVRHLPVKDNLSMTQAGIFLSLSYPGNVTTLGSFLLSYTQSLMIYSNNAGTLSSIISGSQSYSGVNPGTVSNGGQFFFSSPLATNITPGDYYFGILLSSQAGISSTAGGSNTVNSGGISLFGGAGISTNVNLFETNLSNNTLQTALSSLYNGFMGVYNIGGNNSFPNTIGHNNIVAVSSSLSVANFLVQMQAT